MSDPKQRQITIAERLQEKLLQRFEKLIDEGTMTPTDAATLSRLLSANGWSLDPSQIPQNLRSLLTKDVKPTDFEDGDADVPVN